MQTDYKVTETAEYILLEFPSPLRCLTSAPLGGGLGNACNFLNLKVEYNIGEDKIHLKPYPTLTKHCQQLGISPESSVGMMTAADLATFSSARESFHDLWIDACITTGLGNSRRAGEEADYIEFATPHELPAGTINIAVISNVSFSDSALVEGIALATEAKTSTLAEYKIISSKCGKLATGTGTDAIAFFSASDGEKADYCGKHVLSGQMLARAVTRALKGSLKKYFIITAKADWK